MLRSQGGAVAGMKERYKAVCQLFKACLKYGFLIEKTHKCITCPFITAIKPKGTKIFTKEFTYFWTDVQYSPLLIFIVSFHVDILLPYLVALKRTFNFSFNFQINLCVIC